MSRRAAPARRGPRVAALGESVLDQEVHRVARRAVEVVVCGVVGAALGAAAPAAPGAGDQADRARRVAVAVGVRLGVREARDRDVLARPLRQLDAERAVEAVDVAAGHARCAAAVTEGSRIRRLRRLVHGISPGVGVRRDGPDPATRGLAAMSAAGQCWPWRERPRSVVSGGCRWGSLKAGPPLG